MVPDLVIIGGGASGFMGAISAISNGVDWISYNPSSGWLGGNGACGVEWIIQNKIGESGASKKASDIILGK